MTAGSFNRYNTEFILYKSWKPKGLFQFKMIINVLDIAPFNSFEYLCYGSTAIITSFTLYSVGIDFSHQILTSIDDRFWRLVDPRTVRVNPLTAKLFNWNSQKKVNFFQILLIIVTFYH